MKRGPLLAAALFASLAASAWLALQDEDAGAVELATAPRRGGGEAAAPRTLPETRGLVAWPAAPQPRAGQPWAFDAALAAAWVPAPPPVPPPPPKLPPAPPPPPQAPPFPYTLIGRIDDAGTRHALFGGAQRTLGVKLQDVIDGQWRVDGIDGTGVTLTWLPGGLRQTLSFRPS